MLEDLLKSKEFKTIEGEAVKGQDQTVLDDLVSKLETARKSKGFLVCLSYLYEEKGDERLRHRMFKVRFKDGDMPIAIKEYVALAEKELQRLQLANAPVGAVPAPVEENAPKVEGQGEVKFGKPVQKPVQTDVGEEKSKKDEYRVEDDE